MSSRAAVTSLRRSSTRLVSRRGRLRVVKPSFANGGIFYDGAIPPPNSTPISSWMSHRAMSTSSEEENKNPSTTAKQRKPRRTFVPRKAAVSLTERARQFFQNLLAEPPRPDVIGIQLLYQQSSSGEPRMVFSFRFVTSGDLQPADEGVSLELLEDGVTPKPPAEAATDGLPKLYVASDAFLKVLGATLDIDSQTLTPILYDKEGNVMDPNA